ncbi:MAG: hypothetical protein CM1200mP15_16700 [Dehalococcoidia bacterium]|nr:MAG: hypothetical protein CM1200mP15_16700 [Dehalococcoidia bacterium]
MAIFRRRRAGHVMSDYAGYFSRYESSTILWQHLGILEGGDFMKYALGPYMLRLRLYRVLVSHI